VIAQVEVGVVIALIVVFVLLLLIFVIATYNSLVTLRNLVKNSWSNIDTELRRRYDLIPNLVETVKGYAAHERGVLQAVTEARAKAVASTGSPASQAKDENQLVGALKTLFAVSERYPQLKASDNFLKLQQELVNTEDRIQAARRFYNGNVKDLNTRCDVFPSNILAGMFGFQHAEYFEVDSLEVRAPVKVAFGK
jgi:LemA protein